MPGYLEGATDIFTFDLRAPANHLMEEQMWQELNKSLFVHFAKIPRKRVEEEKDKGEMDL